MKNIVGLAVPQPQGVGGAGKRRHCTTKRTRLYDTYCVRGRFSSLILCTCIKPQYHVRGRDCSSSAAPQTIPSCPACRWQSRCCGTSPEGTRRCRGWRPTTCNQRIGKRRVNDRRGGRNHARSSVVQTHKLAVRQGLLNGCKHRTTATFSGINYLKLELKLFLEQ